MADKREKNKRAADVDSDDDYMDAGVISQRQREQGFQLNYINKPRGMSMFRFKEEKVYQLDVMPFVAKPGNPNADGGKKTYERTAYVHEKVGQDRRAKYVCPRKSSKGLRPCPICEYADRMQEQGEDEDSYKHLWAKMRILVQWVDRKDPEKGVQLYEGAYKRGLGELMSDLIDSLPLDDPKRRFYRLKGGYTLHVTAKSDTYKGKTFQKPVRVDLVARSKAIDPELAGQAVCLDDILKELSYKELKEILHQGSAPDDEEEEETPARSNGHKPKPKAKVAKTDDDDDEDEEDDEEEEVVVTAKDMEIEKGSKVNHFKLGNCEVLKVWSNGLFVDVSDDDGEIHKKISVKDVKVVEDEDADEADEDDAEDEDEEAPVARKPGRRPAAVVEDDDEEEEEDADDEDEDEEDDD